MAKVQESAEARIGTNKQDAAGSGHGATASDMMLNDTSIVASPNASIGSNEQVIHWYMLCAIQKNWIFLVIILLNVNFLIYFCR